MFSLYYLFLMCFVFQPLHRVQILTLVAYRAVNYKLQALKFGHAVPSD